MAEEWIDISVSLYSGMVHWPDNPPVLIERMMDIGKDDLCNVSKLSLGAHTGTHMDAPVHWIEGAASIDTMPLDVGIGQARVIAITNPTAITVEELISHNIQAGERILIKTINSERCWETDEFIEDFVYISRAAAQYLTERRVRTVGVDYLSVGGYTTDGPETHRALLEGDVWIIEGLNLRQIDPGVYDLLCLPLKIRGADGAPARALVRPMK